MLYSFLTNTQECISYLRDSKLLPKTLFCCGMECKLHKDKGQDGEIFRCLVCKKKSIRTGSFFVCSKLKIAVVLTIIYYFATGVQAIQCSIHLKGYVAKKAVLQWYTYCREICSLYLLTDGNIRLGGLHSVVQIDETFIRGKLKYERGTRRWRTKPQIIFGMNDTVTKQCYVCIVEDRSQDTLLPIILRYIQLGSEIHSDEARAYFSLNQHGYLHRTVKHKDEFVAIDGTHTNSIENLWSHLKMQLKKKYGMTSNNFPLHLDEFVYRFNKKNEASMFETFIKDIVKHYPVT